MTFKIEFVPARKKAFEPGLSKISLFAELVLVSTLWSISHFWHFPNTKLLSTVTIYFIFTFCIASYFPSIDQPNLCLGFYNQYFPNLSTPSIYIILI